MRAQRKRERMENTSKFSDGLDAFESDQSDIYKGILHLFHPLPQYQDHLPAYRGVAAIDEVPPRIHTKRPLIPTFLSNDNEVERRFAERARNQITPPLFLGPASPSRFDISTCSYKWKRNAMENRHDMPLSSPLPFSFNFDLYFKNSVVQSSHLYSSFYFSHRFGSVKDSVQSISLHYVSMSPPLVFLLFIPIFPLFQSLFSTRSTPISRFLLYSPIFFFSPLLLSLQFLFPKDSYLIISPRFFFLFPSSIYFYLCSIISIF